jgi:hypothetical protein
VFTATLGSAALGTVSYAPDRDVTLVGAQLAQNTSANALVSSDQNLTAATQAGSAPFFRVYCWLGTNFVGPLKIPIPAGERIFIAFSAAGSVTLYFDEGIAS